MYNASKAAVHSLGETLRMELQPLGVGVLTVVTGTVRTQIQANIPRTAGTTSTLPESSLYHPVQAYIDTMYAGTAHPNKTEAAVYAQQVVGDVLGGATGRVWRGANAATARYAAPVLPQSIRVSLHTIIATKPVVFFIYFLPLC